MSSYLAEILSGIYQSFRRSASKFIRVIQEREPFESAFYVCNAGVSSYLENSIKVQLIRWFHFSSPR